MKEMPLNHGLVTLVDDEDYERFAGFKWTAHRAKYTWYVRRHALADRCRPTLRLHRMILGAPDGIQVDHIDLDGLNNTRANLRLCSQPQNSWNQRPSTGGTSKYKGVWWRRNRGKWVAFIEKFGKPLYLGLFTDEEEAALAYNEAAVRLFGEFACLNVISGKLSPDPMREGK